MRQTNSTLLVARVRPYTKRCERGKDAKGVRPYTRRCKKGKGTLGVARWESTPVPRKILSNKNSIGRLYNATINENSFLFCHIRNIQKMK
eukprot:jgi/Botrbrau1/11394/Bobra.0151s0021.1